jgi:hypothetical protein
MPDRSLVTKQADAKGRITLGKAFANKVVLVEDRGDEVVVRLGRVVPERDSWLYENEAALAAVRRGLDQARKGKFADGPDLDAAKALADEIPED